MDINKVPSNFIFLKTETHKKANSDNDVFPVIQIADGFRKSDTYITGSFNKTELLKTGKILDQSEEKTETKRIYSISSDGINSIEPQEDGSYIVDEETHTKAYYGNAARIFLETTDFFDKETEVVIPANSAIQISYKGINLSFHEPGAVLIGAGTQAKIKLLEGDALVTQTEHPPSWYKKLAASGDHKGEFEKLTSLNERLLACLTIKSRFSKDDLLKLTDYGIVKTSSLDENYVKWADFNSFDDMRSRLIESGFTGSSIDEIVHIWENTMKRKLYALECGKTSKSNFSLEQLKKLTDNKILTDPDPKGDKVFWTYVTTENELLESLKKSGFYKNDCEQIISNWRKTTKSGYDNTGLAWEKDKVVAYILRDKINMWNEQDTEWIVHSTEYAGENEPFTVGVSYVKARKELSDPAPFTDIRPAETLHRHPAKEDKKQTEVYMVNNGKAALVTLINGKPNLTFLEKGDMAVINPGVIHCVVAASGNYEHLCFQVPSAFQYGFLFKENVSYDSVSYDEKAILDAAKKGLKSNLKGTHETDSILSRKTGNLSSVNDKNPEKNTGFLFAPGR